MSTSDLYILNKRSTTHFAEFRNGWGSAPIAWDYLGKKYIPEKPKYSFMDGDHIEKVWALYKDQRLDHHERVVLMMTFDQAYVPLDKLEDAGDCCERFGRECEDGAHVNHWSAIGNLLKAAASLRFNRFARGIALSPTSVSDMWCGDEWVDSAWSIYD